MWRSRMFFIQWIGIGSAAVIPGQSSWGWSPALLFDGGFGHDKWWLNLPKMESYQQEIQQIGLSILPK